MPVVALAYYIAPEYEEQLDKDGGHVLAADLRLHHDCRRSGVQHGLKE
jgi:hypothetical protein